MSLESYKKSILEAKDSHSESVLNNIADRYEDDLLEFSDYPGDYFDFFIQLLSDEKFYSKPGIWSFLLVLSTESHKLYDSHYSEIAKTILGNYRDYENSDLKLSICDFIARNYPHEKAETLLKSLQKIERFKTKSGYADEGLRILKNEIMRSLGD